jgi:hypothetical protein
MDERISAAAASVGYAMGQAGGRVGTRVGAAGRAGLRAGRHAAARAVWLAEVVGGSRVLDAVAHSRLLERIVDVQLTRVVPPLAASVLDQVLATLEAEPERVRALVRGQRESMVDELVDHVRSGAAAGDARVDRIVNRVLRRGDTHTETPAEPAGDGPV